MHLLLHCCVLRYSSLAGGRHTVYSHTTMYYISTILLLLQRSVCTHLLCRLTRNRPVASYYIVAKSIEVRIVVVLAARQGPEASCSRRNLAGYKFCAFSKLQQSYTVIKNGFSLYVEMKTVRNFPHISR